VDCHVEGQHRSDDGNAADSRTEGAAEHVQEFKSLVVKLGPELERFRGLVGQGREDLCKQQLAEEDVLGVCWDGCLAQEEIIETEAEKLLLFQIEAEAILPHPKILQLSSKFLESAFFGGGRLLGENLLEHRHQR